MNLDRASTLYRVLKWTILAWCISLFAFLYFGIARKYDGTVLQTGAFLLPGVLYVAALGLTVFLGTALGRFGLKYAFPALLLPVVGLALSVFRLRDHFLRARLAAAGISPEDEEWPLQDDA